MMSGMKINNASIAECVGPLWNSSTPKSMSMSGIMERTKIAGIFELTFNRVAEALPSRYASAMCPTANIGGSP